MHTVELPGYGRSPKGQQLLTVEGLASMLAAYLKDAGVRRAVVVGHSMGAQTVTELALQHPELVGLVVLIGAVTDPRERTEWRSGRRLLQDIAGEPISTNWLVFSDYLKFGIRRYLKTLPAMLGYRLEDNVSKLTVPVLVLRGANDPIAREPWSRLLSASARSGHFAEIPRSRHVAMHTAPAAVAAAVMSRVLEVERSATSPVVREGGPER